VSNPPGTPPDFRVIPSLEQVRQRPIVVGLRRRFGEDATTGALRESADALRSRIAAGDTAFGSSDSAGAWLERDAAARLEQQLRPSLVRVINATGVIVHTNLGRAPLAPAALARIGEVTGGYLNLEYDLEAGGRGARDVHAEALLCRLTGAEGAVVVNNCAAAIMIALAALARGGEVVISRAELVEIGGGFRVPDVMAQSGARLREVGTTNRTRIGDYALAIGNRTGALLRVHPSNFRIEGFTERATLADLVALSRRFGVPLIEDLGSGHVVVAPTGVAPLDREASVQASVAAGVDVICFSGDKLLGGPQAGVIVGRSEFVARIRKHPLMRALRVDKLTYAALEATLVEHLAGRAADTVPALRMASLPVEAVAVRAEIVAASLRGAGLSAEVIDGASTIGGGSAPGSQLPTRLVALAHPSLSADDLEARLRRAPTPVVARIEDGRVVLDLRTVSPADDALLASLISAASEPGA
jgi:L-seryl-tRNA(Ser) seleniumtransferase